MVATLFTIANHHKSSRTQQGQLTHQRREAQPYQHPANNQQRQDSLSHSVLTSYVLLRRSIISAVILLITMAMSSIANFLTVITKILDTKITTSLVETRPSSSRSLRCPTLEDKARFLQKKLTQSRTGTMVQRSIMTMPTI